VGAAFEMVIAILSPPHGTTVNHLLPGDTRMFKVIWDRSD